MDLLSEGTHLLGMELNKQKQGQFEDYTRLLLAWNEKINLTAITDEEGIVVKHFLDSLSIAGMVDLKGKTLIDVGTGAGLPGIPLKIHEKDLTVMLLDSLAKRVKFLKEVISSLSLQGIQAVHGRAEDYGVRQGFREKFDVAVARAVADLSVLCEYCLPFVKIGGFFIAMKGPSVEEEVKESKKALHVLGGELEKVQRLVLPFSDYERSVVLIKKCRHTPSGYPRKSGKPTKTPIR